DLYGKAAQQRFREWMHETEQFASTELIIPPDGVQGQSTCGVRGGALNRIKVLWGSAPLPAGKGPAPSQTHPVYSYCQTVPP
ncbi:MAG: hypothetical protein H7836_13840, partial [Magnetococcus sp. YQC-3]